MKGQVDFPQNTDLLARTCLCARVVYTLALYHFGFIASECPMPLPFQLQKLPPEALDMLRYMGKVNTPVTPDDMEQGGGMSARLVGKAIRRLVNYDYIRMGATGAYELTTDGEIAVQQIAEADTEAGNQPTQKGSTVQGSQRRLTVVMPRSVAAGRATDLYFGVNPPDNQGVRLPGVAHVDLKVSAVNGKLSASSVSLDVPPDKAATPTKVALTPAQSGKTCRIRVDAYQASEFDSAEPLGGMYFDIQVSTDPATKDSTSRAVGMDITLRPPR
jgi:hypothetical protein